MLKLKHSHIKDEWILYNPDSFETCHTHIRHKHVALKNQIACRASRNA